MSPAQLLSHFDRISEAPDAIPRLRRFVLDLAVRGKLAEQDPRDEPASELLKRIEANKARLVNTGEMKKEKPLPAIEEEEIPFAIPANWRWVRLNDITSYLQRGKSPKYATGEGLPVISQKCVQWGGLDLDSAKLITRESIEEYEAIRFLRSGDLLWNSTGTGTIGRIIKVMEPSLKLVCDSHVTVVRCLAVDAEYVRSWIRSDHVYAVIEDRAAGSTNQVELTSQLAMNQVVPLPPLAEQHRIVAKVDELMTLCDRLEAAQGRRESQRDRLAAASLQRLNQPTNADVSAFREHARFYFNHLPRLTTRTEHIQQLRQTILNLAVRGQLVSQDTSDEPASELLKRIQAEKARLLKEGKIGPDKPPIPARADELAFELKPGWQAARLSQILVELQTGPFGSSLHQSDYQKGGIPVINPASIKNERLVPVESMAVGPKTLERLATFKLRAGDIVMARRGEMGRCAFVTKQENGWLCGTGSLILRLPEFVFPHFFVTLIGSPFVREYLGGSAVGATMQNLNQSILLSLVIGLPPLAEQHRIVAKVQELMALCDRLEAQLTTTQTESHRLLEAVLHEALSLRSEPEQAVAM